MTEPEPQRTAIKLNATPNPDAIRVRCPDCDRDPGQPCYEIHKENLNGVSWTSFVVNFPPGQYHHAREQQRVD